jgi:hypothetical protein
VDYTTIGFDSSIRWDRMNQTSDPDADESEHGDSEEPQLDSEESQLLDSRSTDDQTSQSETLDVTNSRLQCTEETSDNQDIDNEDQYWRDQEGRRSKWVEIIDKHGNRLKIWLRSVLDISDSLCSRGTMVWEGQLDSDSESSDANEPCIVVKDSWTDPLRKYTEGMILHILEQHQIEGVPTQISEQQVKTSLRDPERLNMMVNHSTHFLCSALPHGPTFEL